MPGFPPTPSVLTAEQKAAYRSLLYRAMIDIRTLCPSRGRPSWNVLEWRRRYERSRLAGSLADWLHNLAFFSMRDFEGFSEDWFWKDYNQFQPHWERANLGSWVRSGAARRSRRVGLAFASREPSINAESLGPSASSGGAASQGLGS